MFVVEVNNPELDKIFYEMPVGIYRLDPNWVKPLQIDIENVFKPTVNKYLSGAEVRRWLVFNNRHEVVGRIAAFTGHKQHDRFGEPLGAIGFFECINDIEPASLLFKTAQYWLQEKGMTGMDGPVNFGERDRWWGLLIDGYSPPAYCMNYNPPYYRQLFETYGFKIFFKQYTFYRRIEDPVPEKYRLRAEKLLNNPAYMFKHIEKKHLNTYAGHFMEVYNKAWGMLHKDFKPVTPSKALQILESMRPIIDEKIIYFGYYNNQPIGFFICLPEINAIVRLLNGRFSNWHRLKFWWYLKTGYCKRMFGVVFGVVPEHQNKGVESALIMTASKVLQSGYYTRYEDMELAWIGDFNPKMVNIVRGIGGKLLKTHATYRYWFDENKPVEHHEILGMER
ncbi:MAG: hypothetical protein IPM47_13715 [Sphingobacteriales bacterium]|nr:MAG: hypothetical protein IPM47_13715 [Sphingobacteriales bacterium]